MIRVLPQPEPEHFDVLVRSPGQAFLLTNPRPTSNDFRNHSYWTAILEDLRKAYNSICAYYCQYVAPVTGFRTVEHFKSKSRYPNLAYEWSNYRFVCGHMNGKKRDFEDVLDPFTIGDGWFQIDFDTFMVRPNSELPLDDYRKVKRTIDRLKLNDTICVIGRIEVLEQFVSLGIVDLEYLESVAPFIARELQRQQLVEDVLQRFRHASE